MLYENNRILKDTLGVNSNLILNDIDAIKMRIELIFNRECETYSQILIFNLVPSLYF